MERLRPDVNWRDTDRISVLYGPFPSQNLKPEAWSAKMNFWVETIEKWLRLKSRSTFSLDDLEKELSFGGRKPHCLRDVLSHWANETRSISRLTDLQTKFAEAEKSSASWSGWTMSVLRSGVSGLVQKVSGSGKEISGQEVFVHPKILEELSASFLDKLKSSKSCFKINKVLFVDLADVDPDQEFPEKDLMLKFLKYDASCDFTTLDDGKTFVKIADKRQSNAIFSKQVCCKSFLRMPEMMKCDVDVTSSVDRMMHISIII